MVLVVQRSWVHRYNYVNLLFPSSHMIHVCVSLNIVLNISCITSLFHFFFLVVVAQQMSGAAMYELVSDNY